MCMWIYCRYITKNGVRIYPKNKRYFRFWVDDEKAVDENTTDKKQSLTDVLVPAQHVCFCMFIYGIS